MLLTRPTKKKMKTQNKLKVRPVSADLKRITLKQKMVKAMVRATKSPHQSILLWPKKISRL